ncbi:hypothetical protein GGI11_004008, partial [Coemansia sp. RSA 2049]
MLKLRYDDAIQYVFPALLLAVFVYVAKDWVVNRLASRRRSKLDPREMARLRVLPVQRNDVIEDKPSSLNGSPDTAEFFVKPQKPKSTTTSFGSQSMTMNGGVKLKVDLDMADQTFESGD